MKMGDEVRIKTTNEKGIYLGFKILMMEHDCYYHGVMCQDKMQLINENNLEAI